MRREDTRAERVKGMEKESVVGAERTLSFETEVEVQRKLGRNSCEPSAKAAKKTNESPRKEPGIIET